MAKFTGTADDDTIVGSGVSDTIDGGGGNDTLYGYGDGSGVGGTPPALDPAGGGAVDRDSLLGGLGDDRLYGGGGGDTLVGSDGDDDLDGGEGADSMAGGEGADTYFVDNAGDKVAESGKITSEFDDDLFDTVLTTLASYTLGANLEILGMTGDVGSTGKGNGLRNKIVGTGKGDLLQGMAGDDVLYGDGDSPGGGNDTLDGGAGNDSLTGGEGDDLLLGGAGNDTLDGNDTVEGGGAPAGVADTMRGGAGDDVYLLSDPDQDLVEERANQGTDTVVVGAAYTLGAHLENLELTGSSDIDGTGNTLNNAVIGNLGANSLTGGLGNDTLDGGNDDAVDTLDGGAGNDTYILYGGTADVIQDSAGIDTVVSQVNRVLADDLENLTLIGAALMGTGNALANRILGDTGNDTLIGGNGSDTLEGGDGDDDLFGSFNDFPSTPDGVGDLLKGGEGNDDYVITELSDKIVETGSTKNGSDDHDQVYAFLTSYTLGANLEDLRLRGAGNSTGIGNKLNNFIEGTAADDTLRGLAGNDSLLGGNGADSLDGGAGNDTLDGGAGADVLKGGAGNDRYVIPDGFDVIVEMPNQGTDTVVVGVAYTLGGHLENLELTGSSDIDGTGNALNNAIEGNTGANLLTGGLGNDTLDGGGDDGKNDTLDGGAGNDTYVVADDSDNIVDSAGLDTVVSHDAAYTLADGLENLMLAGAAVAGTGNGANNRMLGTESNNSLSGLDGNDTLDGGAGDDQLGGGAGNDSLIGGQGDDKLFANSGADTMAGGAGNDSYFIDGTAQKVVETKGQGTDTVFIAGGVTNYKLPTDVEYLDFSESTGDVIALGNALTNKMTGNGGANRIDGSGGDDTLIGNAGNDTLIGGAGNDILVGGAGADILAGGTGKDIYSYGGTDVLGPADLIQGFAVGGAGQDVVDLDAVLDTLGVADADRAGRVSFVDTGADVELRLDSDGNGSFDWTVLTFQGLADVGGLSAGTAAGDDVQLGSL